MRTVFTVGFRKDHWTPMFDVPRRRLNPYGGYLGQETKPTTTEEKASDFFSIENLAKITSELYKGKQLTELTEEERKKVEAQARIEQARVEAERLRAAGAVVSPSILGVPRDYFIVGGIGIAAIALIIAVAS